MAVEFKIDPKYELWRWRIFGITWLAYAGFYLTRQSFPVAKIGIDRDPNVLMSSQQMGEIDGLYLIAYAIGQFIWGISGDKFGTRRIVLMELFSSVVAGFVMGVSTIVLMFGIFAFIQGLSQSTGWAPLAKNIGNCYSLRERGVIKGRTKDDRGRFRWNDPGISKKAEVGVVYLFSWPFPYCWWN
jgi:sugar phosphate permease